MQFVETNDVGAKETSNETYAEQGSGDNYLFNIWSNGGALTKKAATEKVKERHEAPSLVACSANGAQTML